MIHIWANQYILPRYGRPGVFRVAEHYTKNRDKANAWIAKMYNTGNYDVHFEHTSDDYEETL